MSPLADTLKAHQGLIVVRMIDYDCAYQFWLLDMTAAEFETWWQAQKSFEANPRGAVDELYRALNQEPPPHWELKPPGTFLDVQTEEDLQLWREYTDSRRYHFSFMCCDFDSVLITPDQRKLYHQGDTSKGTAGDSWN